MKLTRRVNWKQLVLLNLIVFEFISMTGYFIFSISLNNTFISILLIIVVLSGFLVNNLKTQRRKPRKEEGIYILHKEMLSSNEVYVLYSFFNTSNHEKEIAYTIMSSNFAGQLTVGSTHFLKTTKTTKTEFILLN